MVINQTSVLYKLHLNTSFDKNFSICVPCDKNQVACKVIQVSLAKVGCFDLLLSGDLPILKGKRNTCSFTSLLIIIVTCSTPY